MRRKHGIRVCGTRVVSWLERVLPKLETRDDVVP